VPPSNDKIRAARQAGWYVPSQGSVRQVISGMDQMTVSYKGVSGAEAIAEVRRMLTCGTYVERTIRRTLTGEVGLPRVAGVDAQYAYCEISDVVVRCVGLLARGTSRRPLPSGGRPVEGHHHTRAADRCRARQGLNPSAAEGLCSEEPGQVSD
jgi:hypothetical protein